MRILSHVAYLTADTDEGWEMDQWQVVNVSNILILKCLSFE